MSSVSRSVDCCLSIWSLRSFAKRIVILLLNLYFCHSSQSDYLGSVGNRRNYTLFFVVASPSFHFVFFFFESVARETTVATPSIGRWIRNRVRVLIALLLSSFELFSFIFFHFFFCFVLEDETRNDDRFFRAMNLSLSLLARTYSELYRTVCKCLKWTRNVRKRTKRERKTRE